MIFININKEKGQIKFKLKINNEIQEVSTYQILLNKLEKENKTSNDEYNIILNNNYEINFSLKIIKNEKTNLNIPRNSIRDRINFFSSKAKEAEKQKNIFPSKKENSNINKVRKSCVINNSTFEKSLNSIINNLEKKDNNPIKNNKENEVIKNINKNEIIPKIEDKDNLNKTEMLANPVEQNVKNNDELNKTQNLVVSKKSKISNFIRGTLKKIKHKNKDNNNNNNDYTNINKSQVINKNEILSNLNNKKTEIKPLSNIQNKKQIEEKQISNNIDNKKTEIKPLSNIQNKKQIEEKQISNNIDNKKPEIKPLSNIPNKKQIEEKQISKNIDNKKNEIKFNIQNKKQIEDKTLSIKQNQKKYEIKINEKIDNELKTKSSKELGKILIKSPSSSNVNIKNNIKDKLPQLSTKEIKNIKLIDDTQSTSISSNRSSVTELILDAINFDTYLEQQDMNTNKKENQNLKERETFCEGFFIASFPKENGKVIENSFSFRAPCGHIKCAKLPSMKPEIIMRYPLKDTPNLDINNLAASICFPTGIKVCYFENNPTIMKDYVTPITNQKGERYYMMTYHFFNKMTNSEFTKSYEENPLKHHLRRFGEAYINLREDELTEKMVNEIQETLKFCEELGFRDYVYIPYCLCLISKYPYINEMEKCLQSIYYLMVNQINDSNIELNKLIMFLIHSIPIPLNRNSKLKFYIPYYNNGIEIACPKLNDINIINVNISILFKWFNIENIITILKLILFEKKLLFVDDNYERISNVIDIFITLIYPFKWIHTYIPIMSEEMINYIETFLPFVNGVHNSLLYLIKKLIKENACETVNNSSSNESENDDVFYLIYITENRIGLSSEFKNQFKNVKTYIKENIPGFPQNLEIELIQKLKNVKNDIILYINSNNNNKLNFLNKYKNQDLSKYDLKLRNIFIEFFVDMLNGFYKYLALLDNNDVVFNKKLFINEKPLQDQKFYEELIETQIFQQFIQTITINDDYNYFKALIIHNKNYTKCFSTNYNNKNESYYYVIPDSFENSNNDIKKIKKILKEDCYINDIQINENGILPNTNRIVTSIKSIDNNKYINKNCSIYLLPQFKNNNNIYNDKDMEKLNINFLKKYENYKPDIDTINETEEISEKSQKIKLNINLNQEHMTEKEIDDLEEYIKDFTIKLFSSEKINIYNPKLKTEIQKSISNSYGRKYFINLLLKNISNNNLIILDYSYFNFLGSLIYNLILSTLKIEETDEILEQIIFLIKSTNYFGKKEYDKHGINMITLWEIYKPKIQINPKVIQTNFWNKWYEIEFKNAEEKTEEEMQEIIYRMCDTMICLELPKSFIKNVLKGLTEKLFGKDTPKNKDTFDVFIKKIVNAKYVSQALI